jgi:enoyl-CoA hydratase/carnithine racemase
VTTALVQLARRGPIFTLTLDSPRNRNALSPQLLDELADGLAEAAADTSVRVVVLTATGKVFCSGADLSAPPGASTSRMPEVLEAIRAAPVPVIARVGGHARAGGLGLIAASDLAVATADSSFAFSEVRVGVAPAIILVPLLRGADRRFLTRAALTGEPFGAAEAAGAGILTGVVDNERALDEWVDGAVTSILASAPRAVAATKALLSDLAETPWREGLTRAAARSGELFAGAEAAEGMDAFLHKRTPSWAVTTP